MWHMINLSNMPKAVAGQAPPEHRLCMVYCSGSKEMALAYKLFGYLLHRTTSPSLTLYHSWYGDSSRDMNC